MDPRRLMQVWAPGLARVSSGYLIGERLVLTAWHATADGVRDDGDDLEVRLFDPAGVSAWLTARRVWAAQAPETAARPEWDVALVKITDPAWITPTSLPPVRFGKLDGGEPMVCRAVGFPRAQVRPDGVRESKDIEGRTEPNTALGSGLVVFTVTNSAPDRDGAWAGGSGAALYCGDLVVGVLVEDHEEYRGSQLRAVSLAQLADSTDLRAVLEDAGMPPVFEPVRAERVDVSAWARFRERSRAQQLTLTATVFVICAAIAAAVIIPLTRSNGHGSGQSPASNTSINYIGTINNYGPSPAGPSPSTDPRAQIVQLTGSWSDKGLHDAIDDRNTSIVALYLKSGLAATTIYERASIILFGFQGVPQNGDPVALVKTFQAAGFKVDDELQDGYLMGALTDGYAPLMFNTNLTPKGYTGGYQDGTFVGSLMFWIVQRAVASTVTDEDIQVVKYLIGQGADCKVPLSFLEYNSTTLSGLSAYDVLLPMMRNCAK